MNSSSMDINDELGVNYNDAVTVCLWYNYLEGLRKSISLLPASRLNIDP
jgi:hypothetical protein